jgi:hypothetical protein
MIKENEIKALFISVFQLTFLAEKEKNMNKLLKK